MTPLKQWQTEKDKEKAEIKQHLESTISDVSTRVEVLEKCLNENMQLVIEKENGDECSMWDSGVMPVLRSDSEVPAVRVVQDKSVFDPEATV